MLRTLVCLLVALATVHFGLGSQFAAADEGAVRVLLMTGQNNHNWKATTPVLIEVIKAAGRFDLEVDTKPWDFGPEAFDNCDVVFSNWSVWPKIDSNPWDDATKQAFLKFIDNGGGLVVMHAGSSIHYPWDEFQALVGATWRKGKTWHGAKHAFKVSSTGDHPITRGIGEFEIFDELWRDMDPTGEFDVLAEADTANDKKPGQPAPMIMTTQRGKGRGVNLVLGHDTRSMESPEFRELLLRCLEWAATGDVHGAFNPDFAAGVVSTGSE